MLPEWISRCITSDNLVALTQNPYVMVPLIFFGAFYFGVIKMFFEHWKESPGAMIFLVLVLFAAYAGYSFNHNLERNHEERC